MLERKSSLRREPDARSGERLKERRRLYRRRAYTLLGFLALVVLGGAIWGTWQSSVRIATITVNTGDPVLQSIAKDSITGSYFGIIPRDSIFFAPLSDIRAAILEAYPRVAAVSIARSGFTTLSITASERAPAGRWCGLQKTEGVPEYPSDQVSRAGCYFFDANGFIFAASDTASTTVPLNPFDLYAPLIASSTDPLRGTIVNTGALPRVFDFARQVSTLGSLATSITLRGDEVTVRLASGTDIIYVLGKEKEAFGDLMSSEPSFNVRDGSILYVDLRFPGKVYLKRKSDTVNQ